LYFKPHPLLLLEPQLIAVAVLHAVLLERALIGPQPRVGRREKLRLVWQYLHRFALTPQKTNMGRNGLGLTGGSLYRSSQAKHDCCRHMRCAAAEAEQQVTEKDTLSKGYSGAV
jgi:hypothetical protein